MKNLGRIFFIIIILSSIAFFTRLILNINISKYTKPSLPTDIDVKDITIIVSDKEKKVWEIFAKRATIRENESTYQIQDVYKGILYRKGAPPFFFKTPSASYNSQNKNVKIPGPVEFYSSNGDYMKTGNVLWDGTTKFLEISKTATSPVFMRYDGNSFYADSLEVNENYETFRMLNNVVVLIPNVESTNNKSITKEISATPLSYGELKNLVLKADSINYDKNLKLMRCNYYAQSQSPDHLQHEDLSASQMRQADVPTLQSQSPNHQIVNHQALSAKRQAPFLGLVFLAGERTSLTAKEMTFDFKNKFAYAMGKVNIVKKAQRPDIFKRKVFQTLQKRDTNITSEETYYYWREGRYLFPTNVIMTQKDLSATSSSADAVFNYTTEQVNLYNNVILKQLKGDWLFQEGVVDATDLNEETEKTIKNKTTVKAARISIDTVKENIEATGMVSIMQEKKSLYGQSAYYTTEKNLWHITGNPTAIDEDETLTATEFVFDPDAKEFKANGAVLSKFSPKDEMKNDLKKYITERDRNDKTASKPDFEKEKVSVDADFLKYSEKQNLLFAYGNVVLKYVDITIKADKLRVDYENKKIWGLGNVVGIDKYSEIKGEEINADWDKNEVTITGEVILNYKGKKAPKSTIDNQPSAIDNSQSSQQQKYKREPFTLTCNKIFYNWDTKQGYAVKNPIVKGRTRDIKSEKITINLEDNIYEFFNNVKIHQTDGNWLKEMGHLTEKDKGLWEVANKETTIDADYAKFIDDDDYFLLIGNVNAVQKEKTLTAQRIEVFGKEKKIFLDGSINLTQESGNWLFEEKLIDENEDEELRERIRKKIKISTNKMELNYAEKEYHLIGRVKIIEGNSFANGDEAWYFGNDRKIILIGNVRMQDEESKFITSDKIVYNLNDKIFESFKSVKGKGQVRTQ